jgi:NAD(P)-dependent dehydrogenase (short-subunit alcohol dehydrogenase family)
MPTFTNKVALVTGGTSGIGRATAVAFAREGARVVVAGRREIEGAETVRLLSDAGSDGLFVRTDVSKEAEVKSLAEQTVATFGRLDYAFNNAGIEQSPGPVERASRSSRVTVTTSPGARVFSNRRNWARSVLAPLATPRNTFLHPALVSWRTCASTLWPSVDTCA